MYTKIAIVSDILFIYIILIYKYKNILNHLYLNSYMNWSSEE